MKEMYSLFESWLAGELSFEEKVTFEARLQAEPDLRRALDEYLEIRKTLQGAWQQDPLRQTLADLGKEYFPSRPNRLRLVWIPLAIAATFALAILFFLPASLFKSYYERPLASFSEKGTEQDALLQQAETAFNAGDMQQARTTFEKILQEDPDNLQAALYLGVSLLELGQYQQARQIFQPLASGDSALAGEAQWYLAMTFLREKNYAECLKALPTEGFREEQARELEQKLRSKIK